MTKTSDLISEIKQLPKGLQSEVKTFVDDLKAKNEIQNNYLKKRQFGFAKGKVVFSKDFNKPLIDFQNYQ